MSINSSKNLKDFKRMKRNMISTTLKEIGESKLVQIGRSSDTLNFNQHDARSSPKQNNHQSIRNIDEKLELHQSEIDKNNSIIQELNHKFDYFQNQLQREQELLSAEEKRNRSLRDEIERTNRLLKSKNHRIEEQHKKIIEIEKELESTRHASTKLEELAKSNSHLRKNISHMEEELKDRKALVH